MRLKRALRFHRLPKMLGKPLSSTSREEKVLSLELPKLGVQIKAYFWEAVLKDPILQLVVLRKFR